jgi:hypothetical protein
MRMAGRHRIPSCFDLRRARRAVNNGNYDLNGEVRGE